MLTRSWLGWRSCIVCRIEVFPSFCRPPSCTHRICTRPHRHSWLPWTGGRPRSYFVSLSAICAHSQSCQGGSQRLCDRASCPSQPNSNSGCNLPITNSQTEPQGCLGSRNWQSDDSNPSRSNKSPAGRKRLSKAAVLKPRGLSKWNHLAANLLPTSAWAVLPSDLFYSGKARS